MKRVMHELTHEERIRGGMMSHSPRVRELRLERTIKRVEALAAQAEENQDKDVARETLQLMLLEECPQDPSMTNVEYLCDGMVKQALGMPSKVSIPVAMRVFSRAYGDVSSNENIFKHVKQAFAGYNVITQRKPDGTTQTIEQHGMVIQQK